MKSLTFVLGARASTVVPTVVVGVLTAGLLLPALLDAIEKSKRKREMSRARLLGASLFAAGDFGWWAAWLHERCSQLAGDGPHSVWMSPSELEAFVRSIPGLDLELDELRPLADLQVGSFCNCERRPLWIKTGEVVWMDGYLVSMPKGLDGAGQRLAGYDCRVDRSANGSVPQPEDSLFP